MVGLPEADTVIATILTPFVSGKEAYGTGSSVTKLRCPPFPRTTTRLQADAFSRTLRNILALFMRFGIVGKVLRQVMHMTCR